MNDVLDDYRTENNITFYTFSDWQTEKSGDTITFVVENGTVTKDFKSGIRSDIARNPAGKKDKGRNLTEEWFGK